MTEFIFSLALILALAAISTAQPFLTRPELFFAVTVAGNFRSSVAARRIVGQYRLIGWTGTIIAAALVYFASLSPHVGPLLSFAAWVAAYFVARRRVWPYRVNPTSIREASLRRRESFPGGPAVLAGPFVILAAKAFFVSQRWDQIPERIAVHWGFDGPDRWVERSEAAVYGAFGAIAAVCALMLAMSYGTVYASRRVSANGGGDSSEQRFRSTSVLGLVAVAYMLAILLPPIDGVLPVVPYTPFLILGISILLVVVLAWFGQGGSRLRGYQPAFDGSAPTGDRTPDDRWKLGMFYYNPDDPALVVEKRFGIGWTLNFANRWCWVVVVAIFAFPFLMRLLRDSG